MLRSSIIGAARRVMRISSSVCPRHDFAHALYVSWPTFEELIREARVWIVFYHVVNTEFLGFILESGDE